MLSHGQNIWEVWGSSSALQTQVWNGWKLDKFTSHIAKAMNCLRTKQGERRGGLTSLGANNETKKRQALIQFWWKREKLGWWGTESHGTLKSLISSSRSWNKDQGRLTVPPSTSENLLLIIKTMTVIKSHTLRLKMLAKITVSFLPLCN